MQSQVTFCALIRLPRFSSSEPFLRCVKKQNVSKHLNISGIPARNTDMVSSAAGILISCCVADAYPVCPNFQSWVMVNMRAAPTHVSNW